MTDAVTISRETLRAALRALEAALSDDQPYIAQCRAAYAPLRAALAAQTIDGFGGNLDEVFQPVEPVATSYADHQQRIGAPLTFFTSVAAQAYRAAATRDDVTHEDAMRVALQAVQGAAPPAPAAVPLTVSEIERMWSDAIMNGADGAILFARAIERAHSIAAAGDKP